MSTQTHADRAYDVLKRKILTCELAPGAELREAALAEITDLGRSAIREALGRLVKDGFVEVRPRQGYRVTELKVSDIQDVFEMRLLLEPPAAATAAVQATAEQLDHLRRLVDEEYSTETDLDIETMIVSVREFHVEIARITGNERLARTTQALLEEMQRLFFVRLSGESDSASQLTDSRALCKAIASRDPEFARSSSIAQIEHSRQRLLDTIGTMRAMSLA